MKVEAELLTCAHTHLDFTQWSEPLKTCMFENAFKLHHFLQIKQKTFLISLS